MGKFVSFLTYDRFLKFWDEGKVNTLSMNFILDTGQLYTHGIFINSAVFGTAANGAVTLSIAGTTNTLALSNHTHSNYLENNADIDITGHKITSNSKDLITYSGGALYIGGSDYLTYVNSSSNLKVIRDSHTYDVLDTGNFSIEAKTSTGLLFNNVALFTYGSNSFQLDYVRRYNVASTFDSLRSTTSMGTNLVDSKLYGYMTFYTEGTVNNPAWAQIRVNIPDRIVEFRTSATSNEWLRFAAGALELNALNVAGIVAAPSANTKNKVWKTDNAGNPAWRDETTFTDTWRSVRINDDETDSLEQSVASGPLYIKGGTGITVSFSNSKVVITNSAPNVWQAANSSQEGYVPATTAGKFLHAKSDGTLEWVDDNNTWKAANTSQEGYIPKLTAPDSTINSQAADYVLTFKSGTDTTPTWRKLPVNAYSNSTYTGLSLIFKDSTDGTIDTYEPLSAGKTIKAGSNIGIAASSNVITISAIDTWTAADFTHDGYVPKSVKGKYLHANASTGALEWVDDRYAANTDNTGVKKGTAGTTATSDGTVVSAESSTGLIFEGGTNQFKIGNGTNSITIGVAHGLATKNLNVNGTNYAIYTSANSLPTIYAPSSSGTGFLKGTVNNGVLTWSWDNSTYNNYSLPTASSDTKGGVKTGAEVSDITGMTAVHIKNGVIYYKDTNTTYSFSKLKFQQTSGTDLMTYDSLAARTILAGDNITFTHSNNVLTIKAKDTTYSNFTVATASAAGSAGLVPGPAKNILGSGGYYLRADGTWVVPPNDNTQYYLTLNGTVKGTASSNDLGTIYAPTSSGNGFLKCSVSNGTVTWSYDNTTYLTSHYTAVPVLGGSAATSNATSDTTNAATYLNIIENSAKSGGILIIGSGGTSVKAKNGVLTISSTTVYDKKFSIKSKIGEAAAVTLSDFTANQSSDDDFTLIQGSNITFTNDATNRTLTIAGTANTLYYLTLNGTVKGTSGGTNLGTFYAIATSDTTTANQVWMRNANNNGYGWRTLGSHAFDSTTYATPDTTTTLTRASGNLTKDTWSDVGSFADTVPEGTWVISFTIDGSIYSGVFSRKKNDTMSEEIDLHAAGTSAKRIYARTTGNKIQIATADNTFNPGAVTFNFRKLI